MVVSPFVLRLAVGHLHCNSSGVYKMSELIVPAPVAAGARVDRQCRLMSAPNEAMERSGREALALGGFGKGIVNSHREED